MKKVIILSIAALYIFSSCEEIMPTIPPYGEVEVVSDRKILIEEFTGVGCVNCPAGSVVIENLIASRPSNLIAVSIHGGFFAIPYVDSKYDFRTEDADKLVGTYFGVAPFAFPSATINREKTSTGSFYVDSREWAGLIAAELEQETQVNLEVIHDFNDGDRALTVEVDVIPKTEIPNDLRITVMITENGVKDYQLLPEGWKSDYEHKHMLREIVTPFDGEIVSPNALTPGSSINKEFNFTLPREWNAEKCNVIAFVHRNIAGSKEVLNAEEVHIIE